MGASLLDGAAELNGAIEADHEVVADVFPATVDYMVAADGLNRDVLAFGGRGAVEDYLVNLPLGSLQIQHSHCCLIVVIVRWRAFWVRLNVSPASGCRLSGS